MNSFADIKGEPAPTPNTLTLIEACEALYAVAATLDGLGLGPDAEGNATGPNRCKATECTRVWVLNGPAAESAWNCPDPDSSLKAALRDALMSLHHWVKFAEPEPTP